MSHQLSVQTQKSFIYLKEVETLAQDILSLKDQKLGLSNVQNIYREALRALDALEARNCWIKVGSVYVQRPTFESIKALKSKIESIQEDLDFLHGGIKEKSYHLQDLEHQSKIEGFSLKPMSANETKVLNKAFGLH